MFGAISNVLRHPVGSPVTAPEGYRLLIGPVVYLQAVSQRNGMVVCVQRTPSPDEHAQIFHPRVH